MRKKRFHEIAQLYHVALELPESERAGFLDTCKDEGIRREVESLLANKDMAQSFLEDSALEVASKLKPEEQPLGFSEHPLTWDQ